MDDGEEELKNEVTAEDGENPAEENDEGILITLKKIGQGRSQVIMNHDTFVL